MIERAEILHWLQEDDPERLAGLWRRADDMRRRVMGDEVQLRGLIEVSNHCVRRCAYCGIRAGSPVTRYRMSPLEIFECALQATALGYGTVVLQAGEDPGLDAETVSETIRAIRKRTPLAITLSLGERDDKELAAWRQDGADRYLLRFETSNRALYDRIHPARGLETSDRIALLGRLRALGYETGGGVMVGLPGQTYESVARDIDLFRELDLDMIGIGPFIPHPQTPLGTGELKPVIEPDEQVPNTELIVYKAVALTRLVRPDANIPSTTALATINKRNGRELGLQRGANVLMPNLTPAKYRKLYEIYPAKACIEETGSACNGCLRMRITAIGRQIAQGPGGRKRHAQERDVLC